MDPGKNYAWPHWTLPQRSGQPTPVLLCDNQSRVHLSFTLFNPILLRSSSSPLFSFSATTVFLKRSLPWRLEEIFFGIAKHGPDLRCQVDYITWFEIIGNHTIY